MTSTPRDQDLSPPPESESLREYLQRYFLFAAVNAFIFGIILLPMFRFVPDRASAAAHVYLLAALIVTTSELSVALGIVLLPAALIVRRTRIAGYVVALVYAAAGFLLFVDTVVYSIFRFHLNGLVLNLLMTPGSSDSVPLGRGTWISASLHAALILVCECLVAWRIFRRRVAHFRWARVTLALIATLVLDKGGFEYGSIYGRSEFMVAEAILPFYRPWSVERKAIRWLRLNPVAGNARKDKSSLRYPRAQLRRTRPGAQFNILLIAVEGLRSDMLHPDVMPRLFAWSRQQVVLRNHYSGGNGTRMGIFSLLYGLDGTYWDLFLREKREPLLVTTLRELGYSFQILSVTDLGYPEFRSTAFVQINDAIRDSWESFDRQDRDRAMVDHFLGATPKLKQPWFSFLFFDAPHGFHEFPAKYTRFKPIVTDGNYIELAKRDPSISGPLFNRYRNSLLYVDDQIGRMIEALAADRTLDRTIVIVTGDHGEEFNEYGYYGHNASFDRAQVRTTTVLSIPGRAPELVTALTSHVDIVPTIMTELGISNPASDYSTGRRIEPGGNGSPFALVVGWRIAALIDNAVTIVFSTNQYSPAMEVRDSAYRRVSDEREAVRSRKRILIEAANRMGMFLR